MKVTHVDFFSLDVEGADLAILKTIPFDKVTIDIIMVEYGITVAHTENGELNLFNMKLFMNSLGIYEEVGKLGPVDFVWRRKT